MMDREADTIRTGTMGLAAQYLANHWVQYVNPVPFDRVLSVGGLQVRVTVAAHDGDEVDRRLEQYAMEADYLAPKADK